MSGCASGRCSNRPIVPMRYIPNTNVEFFVRYDDGRPDSEPMSLDEARKLAESANGSARARAKSDA